MKKILNIIGVLLVLFVLSACGDNTNPLIVLEGESTVMLVIGQEYVEPGYRVFDNKDTALEVIVTTDLDTDVAGEYTVVYNVTDGSGNKAAEVVRIVIVENYIAFTLYYTVAIKALDTDRINELMTYTNGLELINVNLINFAYTETKNLEILKLLSDNYEGTDELIVDITYYDGSGLKEVPLELLYLFDNDALNAEVSQWFTDTLEDPETLTYIENSFSLIDVESNVFLMRYEVTYINYQDEEIHTVYEFSFNIETLSLIEGDVWIKDELTNISHIWE